MCLCSRLACWMGVQYRSVIAQTGSDGLCRISMSALVESSHAASPSVGERNDIELIPPKYERMGYDFFKEVIEGGGKHTASQRDRQWKEC